MARKKAPPPPPEPAPAPPPPPPPAPPKPPPRVTKNWLIYGEAKEELERELKRNNATRNDLYEKVLERLDAIQYAETFEQAYDAYDQFSFSLQLSLFSARRSGRILGPVSADYYTEQAAKVENDAQEAEARGKYEKADALREQAEKLRQGIDTRPPYDVNQNQTSLMSLPARDRRARRR